MMKSSFAKNFDELYKMHKNNSPDTQEYFEELIKNLKRTYDRLMQDSKSHKQMQIG